MSRIAENKKQMNQANINKGNDKDNKGPDTGRSSNQGRKLASGGIRESKTHGRSKNKLTGH
jgi:hypothetical protein